MSVYNDMANDAGYGFGTQENEQMAQMLAAEEMYEWQRDCAIQQEIEGYYEILFRRFEL